LENVYCDLLDNTPVCTAGYLDSVPSLAIHLLFDLEKLCCVTVFNFVIRKKISPLYSQFKIALSKSDLLYLFEYYIGTAVLLKI